MRRTIQLCAVALVVAGGLPGVGVKVIAVDHRAGQITIHLPTHNVDLIACLMPGEPEIRVKVKEFYEAAFEPGEIDTARRNVLRIKIPGGKPALFRLLRVRFLD